MCLLHLRLARSNRDVHNGKGMYSLKYPRSFNTSIENVLQSRKLRKAIAVIAFTTLTSVLSILSGPIIIYWVHPQGQSERLYISQEHPGHLFFNIPLETGLLTHRDNWPHSLTIARWFAHAVPASKTQRSIKTGVHGGKRNLSFQQAYRTLNWFHDEAILGITITALWKLRRPKAEGHNQHSSECRKSGPKLLICKSCYILLWSPCFSYQLS